MKIAQYNDVRYNEPVHITGKEGEAVLMSEADYNDLMATLELCAVPGMQKKIVDGLNTSTEECLPADEVGIFKEAEHTASPGVRSFGGRKDR